MSLCRAIFLNTSFLEYFLFRFIGSSFRTVFVNFFRALDRVNQYKNFVIFDLNKSGRNSSNFA